MTSNRDNLSDLTVGEFQDMLRHVVREELHDAGLRIDGDHQDAAREDFRFLRKLRMSSESVSSRIGMVVILTTAGGLLAMLWAGMKLAFRQ